MLPAQSTRPKDLAAGKLLVASRDLGDPNFAHTVVLLVHYDEDGVVGLIVNRRTKVPISRALDELKGAKSRARSHLFRRPGGTIGRSGAGALAGRNWKTPSTSSASVPGDVGGAAGENDGRERRPDTLHVYVGYAGWTPKQLEGEVEVGAWFIFSGRCRDGVRREPPVGLDAA